MFSVLRTLAFKGFQKTRLVSKILVDEIPGSCASVSSVDSCMRSFKVQFLTGNGAVSLSCFPSLCILVTALLHYFLHAIL